MTVSVHRFFSLFFLSLFLSTAPLHAFIKSSGNKKSHHPVSLVTIHIVDRNGFSETISQSDRLKQYLNVDFLQSQPYQKVLRVYSRNAKGEIHSYLTSYHENGTPKQYLEIVNGRASGIYQEWHANGQPSLRTTVIGGNADITIASENTWIFDETSYAWDEEGHLLAEMTYSKGELEGNLLKYHPNGTVWKRVPYHKDMIHGLAEIFLENGSLLQTEEYKMGSKTGTSIRYWPDQKIAAKEEYENGKLSDGVYIDIHGKTLCSIEQGNGTRALFGKRGVSEMQEFHHGVQEGEVKIFNQQGEIISIHHSKEGQKQGEEIEYYPSADPLRHLPRLSIQWMEGRIQGIAKTWYENGVMESQREMMNNKKNGLLTVWYLDGSLMLLEEYEDDSLKRGEYYRKGENRPCSEIIDGQGVASLFDSEGNPFRKITYINGQPEEN